MTLAAYEAYKYSGDKWLGDVPSHWEVFPLKYMADVDNSGAYGKDPEEGENLLPVATTAQIDALGNFVTSKMSLRSFTNKELRRYACNPGDILVVKSSGSAENIISGKAGIVRAETPQFVFSNFLLRLRCHDNRCLSLYLYSLIVSHVTRERVKQMCSTTTYPNLQVPLYVGAELPCPPIAEQEKIVRLLDHETAKIDALILEQERLIELLQEKRQAVISHAVTKGLDPDVPMRDSGVEWLGEVPVHWRVGALKRALEVVADVDHYMPTSVVSGVPYVMTGDLRRLTSEIDLDSCKQITREDFLKLTRKIRTAKGDVIMARYATIGTVSYVDINAEFIVSYSCVTIRPRAELATGLYLFFYFQSDAFIQGISNMINANTQGNVGVGDLKEVKIALPDIDEQKAIVDKLEVELANLDSLVGEVQKSIGLMAERRSALISAAVTGKIDVRDWQPPADESAFDEEVRQAGLEATA